jgi:periplasmic protein CpxP/Spy
MKSIRAGRMLVILSGVLMAAAAWGQEPGPGPMGQPTDMGPRRPPMERSFGGRGFEMRWWNNPRVIEKLKLTDDQRKVFDQILQAHREKLIDLRANLEKAELPMHSLMDAEQPDEGKILAQIDKTVQARAELEKANARFLLALRSKLTPDQWKQLKELRESRPRMDDGGAPGSRRPGQGSQPGQGDNTTPPPPGPQGALDGDNVPDMGFDGPAPGAGLAQ